MYLYKKNIILVPADYDGVSMAKGILSLDCYADKTVCSLRTYNLASNKKLTLGIAVNKKLHKISVNGALNSQKSILDLVINNADNISVVLIDINGNSYDIVLWGSTELNASWRSTLEFMLSEEFKEKNQYDYKSINENILNTQTQSYINNENENFINLYLDENSKKNNQNEDLSDNFDKNKTLFNNEFKNSEHSDNLLDEDFLDVSKQQSQILKNQNLDDFLDNVLNLEQIEDEVLFDEELSHLEDNIIKEDTFYNRISYQIDKMFISNQQEKILNEIIPNSKFCRVEFDDKSGHYVFGIVYEDVTPKYLCYGVPAKKDSQPPKELSGYYQWLPIDIENETGNGYYMMYQDALTGKNISVDIV